MYILQEINVQFIMQHDGFTKVKTCLPDFLDTTKDAVMKRLKIDFTEGIAPYFMACENLDMLTFKCHS
jgi:hypothetical protein